MDFFITQFVTRLQHWNEAHSLYAFAAVLIVYVFIVLRRTDGGS
jgi:hypothetical protein